MAEHATNDYLFKILVVGDVGTGKTSIIKRYVHNIFSSNYKSTIGVDFALKVLNWDPDTIIRLQLWDIAGQERFGHMTRVYYKEAVGAMVVYDLTRKETFEAVQKWKTDIDRKVFLQDEKPIPCILLANKCDLEDAVGKSKEELNKFCQDFNFVGWYTTSAKENKNIDECSKFLVSKILEVYKPVAAQQPEEEGNVKLDAPLQKTGAGCCSRGAAAQ